LALAQVSALLQRSALRPTYLTSLDKHSSSIEILKKISKLKVFTEILLNEQVQVLRLPLPLNKSCTLMSTVAPCYPKKKMLWKCAFI